MRICWEVDPKDIQRVKALVDAHRDHPSVRDRIRRNVDRHGLTLSREAVWAEIVGCLVSTRQRWEKAEQFLRQEPFPLRYDLCRDSKNVRDLAGKILREFGGLWLWKRVADNVHANLDRLERGLWADTLYALEGLLAPPDPSRERAAADFVDDKFAGFGPKQARNLLQGLGLTQYEIPIDSRWVKWLKEFRFPVAVSLELLSDRPYYHFVSDGVQHLCAQCGVYPCVVDAAVFVSFEGE